MNRWKWLLLSQLFLIFALASGPAAAQSTQAWINEIHYDNAGADVGEFVEIAGFAGLDLSGWTLHLYNGSTGTVYSTIALSGVIPAQCGGGAIAFFEAGIQNGSPDGLALTDGDGLLVQFISYEGTFNGVGGPADGVASSDIGVLESSTTPVGFSLQLTGTGDAVGAFTWNSEADDTPGDCNNNQSLPGAVPTTTRSWGHIRAMFGQ